MKVVFVVVIIVASILFVYGDNFDDYTIEDNLIKQYDQDSENAEMLYHKIEAMYLQHKKNYEAEELSFDIHMDLIEKSQEILENYIDNTEN